MMGGCLRNVFAIVGCATLLVVGGILGWQYRAQVAGAWRSLTGQAPAVPDSIAEGQPTEDALRSAFEKRDAMADRNGPGLVTLTADEMAALIEWGLDPVARGALDSFRVRLGDDRFALRAQLNTGILTREMLGPFAGMLQGQEPLRMAGPARLAETGVVAWEIDDFMLRAFPFPDAAIPPLVNRLTGGTGGWVPIAVPPTVGDVRIAPDGVTFYRRND